MDRVALLSFENYQVVSRLQGLRFELLSHDIKPESQSEHCSMLCVFNILALARLVPLQKEGLKWLIG